ncbi:SurA N-terminal domain-containing protein [Desulfobacterales bacterium HSG2]|nr:SurA N-terminal domain-containing protein [Desulfobacterales bacterium HSG2]
MLKLMREHATSWLIKIILGAIIIVFVLYFGSGSMRQPRANRIAFVNGEPITAGEYRDAYNKLVDRYRQFGTKLNQDMIKRLEKQTLDNLIDQSLMRQEAKNLNIRVTDKELTDAILKMDVFQTNGVFNKRLYTNLLNNNRLTPEAFEDMQRESMLTEKLRSFMLSNIKVSDQEALEWFKWNDASISIEYVLFESKKYKDIKPTPEEIKAHFEENKDSYKTKPKVKAQFLHFKSDDYKSKIELTDEEIQDYYDSNKDEFKEEKTVEARHILLKLDKGSTPEVEQEKKEKILEILEMARGGQDFAELAKTHSEGPTKTKGGDLGAFKKGAMVKPFSDKAFSMKPGEISDPVRTRFGWHIIKVEKVNEEKTLSPEEAKGKITEKLTDNKTKEIAYDEAEKVYDSVFEGDNLVKVAETRGLEIKTTDFFTKSGPRKGVKNRSKFASAAFKLSPMEISEPQDFGDGYHLVQMLEKMPEKTEEFKDAERKVRRDIIKKKQEEKANKDASDFLAALNEEGSMSAAGEKLGATPKTTDFFKRNDSVPDIGYEREIAQAAFKLSNEKKFPDHVLKGRKGYYVIAFKEKKTPEPEEFEKEKEKVKERLLQQKKFRTFDAWLSQVKKRSEISIDADF